MSDDVTRRLFARTQARLDKAERERRQLATLGNVAGIASGVVQSTLANAPLAADGQIDFALRFITDGRKAGESAGNGTGVLAMYNPATDEWLNIATYAAVTV